MFTQKISMDCTKEQYEKYLKAELEKMGYGECMMTDWRCCDGIVNNLGGDNGAFSNVGSYDFKDRGRTYLGKFNAPLFLALAAMTDKRAGGYKEKITDGQGNWASLSPFGYCTIINGDGADRYAKWHKATVSEIMAKFGEPKAEPITIAIDITNHSDEKRCYYGSEEQMISLLKSKGYKIFKQTTTLEEV